MNVKKGAKQGVYVFLIRLYITTRISRDNPTSAASAIRLRSDVSWLPSESFVVS